MASLRSTDSIIHPEQTVPEQHVPEQTVPKKYVPEQPVHEQHVLEHVIVDQSLATTSIFAEPEISLNDQPSSSNLALQTSFSNKLWRCSKIKPNLSCTPLFLTLLGSLEFLRPFVYF